jgi:uncharacterized membrane protein
MPLPRFAFLRRQRGNSWSGGAKSGEEGQALIAALFIIRKSALGRLDMLDAIVHTLHVILAGAWLGGVVFTTTVVSPALKSMGWNEAEQARVRSVIGRQYAKVGTANLILLLVLALLEGILSGFGSALYSEYALLAVLFGLVATHGAYFGRRLVELAEARKEAGDSEKAQMLALRRRRLQRLSFGVSMLVILISAVVMILAAYARVG